VDTLEVGLRRQMLRHAIEMPDHGRSALRQKLSIDRLVHRCARLSQGRKHVLLRCADHRSGITPELHGFELEVAEAGVAPLRKHHAVTSGPIPEQGARPVEVDEVDGVGAGDLDERGSERSEICGAVGEYAEVPVRVRTAVPSRPGTVQHEDVHPGHGGMRPYPGRDLVRSHDVQRTRTHRSNTDANVRAG
jgi:hypothetical protein